MRSYFAIPLTLAFLNLSLPARLNAQSTIVVSQDVAKSDSTKKDSVMKKGPVYRGSNTRSSDILHSKLEVSFDWKTSTMNGRASISVRPYFYPGKMLYLNAKGMEIRSVQAFVKPDLKSNPQQKGSDIGKLIPLPLSYVYENDSLKISLSRSITSSETYTVVIDYLAKPNELKKVGGSNAIMEDKGLYFVNPSGENPYKIPQIWTQGETQANSVWFPTIDSPNEKMTQDIYITVDQKFTTLSNGVLADSKPAAGGTRTDHWKMDQPHAPYLAMMAIGEFKKVTDTPWKGKEISYYVEKEYEPHAKAIFGDTREMIDFYSKTLGVDYAWPKYSQVVVRDYVSGAMENTSATLHGDFMVYHNTRDTIDGKKANAVIAHELFHQWFGDLVTCESWSNLPLNESFATYGEYLWEEYKYGREAADLHHWQSKQGYMGSEKEVNLIRFEYNDKEDMFDAFSYNKGAQVLHMLRKEVGDQAFFASLKNYLESNRYKSAEIHHLRLAFEETTGRDLNWFFNQWFLNKGRPKLKVSKAYNSATRSIELTVEQTQNLSEYPLYLLPLEVDIYTQSGLTRHRIEVKDQKQHFTFKCETEPSLINFDAERQLLCDLDYAKSKENYFCQYAKAPLFEDRLEALKKMETSVGEKEVFELFKQAALGDRFYYLRSYAMTKLEKAPEEKNPELKQIFLQIYAKDPKTLNRAKALAALNRKFPADAEITALNEQALSEKSPAICAQALESISKQNPELALKKAKTFENETSKSVFFAVVNIYGEKGADSEIAFFHNGLKQVSGFELMSYCNAYTKVAKRCAVTANVLTAATDMELVSKGAGKFVKYAALKGVKDLLAQWEAKENTARKMLEVSKSDEQQFAKLDKEVDEAAKLREKLNEILNRMK